MDRRVSVLAGILILLGLLSTYILREVFGTIFFAVTVAYVLYPIRQRLVDRGLGQRTAAAISTALAFVAVALIMLPIAVVLYLRLGDIRNLQLLQNVKDQRTIEIAGMTREINFESLIDQGGEVAQSLAFSIASSAPALGFKLFLFVLLVYGLLIRPNDVSAALLRPVPREYHDIVMSLHDRTRATLYAIYILQAATAVGTFLMAYVFFWAFGYDAIFSLAVISGILQFVPIIGPSVVILAIASFEVAIGNTTQALLVGGLGIFFIGFLPDALIRPQLASLTAGMPGSLYFIGFVGGILSVGVVGIIAGPVLVGLLAEVGELLADERMPHSTTEPTD